MLRKAFLEGKRKKEKGRKHHLFPSSLKKNSPDIWFFWVYSAFPRFFARAFFKQKTPASKLAGD